MPKNMWPPEDIQTMLDMKEAGKRNQDIAAALGRTESAVETRLRYQRMSAEQKRERALTAEKMRREKGVPVRNSPHYVATNPKPTADRWAERDRRLYSPRPVGSWLMGDPPPGYSALDRRQGTVA